MDVKLHILVPEYNQTDYDRNLEMLQRHDPILTYIIIIQDDIDLTEWCHDNCIGSWHTIKDYIFKGYMINSVYGFESGEDMLAFKLSHNIS